MIKVTTNRDCFSNDYNNIIDDLLSSYADAHPEIIQADDNCTYTPMNLYGEAMLKKLVKFNIVEEVFDD